jgi:hypothetical protein
MQTQKGLVVTILRLHTQGPYADNRVPATSGQVDNDLKRNEVANAYIFPHIQAVHDVGVTDGSATDRP